MNLTTEQRERVAEILARTFPQWERRSAVVDSAGIRDAQLTGDPANSWRVLVRQAQEQDRLVQLFRAASRHEPGSRQLRALAAGAEEGRLDLDGEGSWDPSVLATIGALLVAAVVIWGWIGWSRSAAPEEVAERPAMEQPAGAAVVASVPERPEPARPAPKPARVEVEEAAAEAEPPPAEAEPPPAEAAPPPGEAAAPAEAPPEPEAAPPPAPAAASDRPRIHSARSCPGRVGEVVGWAYAGSRSPGDKGDVWAVGQAVNVRQERPSDENGWSPRAPVVCVLSAGAEVDLHHPPVLVEGGAWWVPVVAGAVR